MLILKKGIKVYDEIIATATTQTSYHRGKVAIAKLVEFKRNTTEIQKEKAINLKRQQLKSNCKASEHIEDTEAV